MRKLLALGVGVWLALGFGSEARADFVLTEALDVGIAGLYYASGSFLDEPGEESGIPYPGFAGFNPSGAGFALEARYLGIVGLEIDLFFTEDKGNGEKPFDFKRFTCKNSWIFARVCF